MKNKILKRMFLTTLLMLTVSVVVFAQTGRITGTVVDQTGVPVIGANVQVKGAAIGSITDLEGRFAFDAPQRGMLVVSFIGYITQEIALGRSNYSITIIEDTEILDEVVVIGYGTQKKSDLTGSVTSIKAEDLSGIRGGNASEALQGKAGLHVVTSGEPGVAPTVRVRGIGTDGDASPVYVVDGVMTDDISFLNPKDIESMNVLKDASATAIYGSRGANGVIMVTTKRGKSGKPIISYNGSEGFQYVIDNYDVANGAGYAQIMNAVAKNEGSAEPYTNPSSYGKGTDWLDEMTRNGWMRDHQLSVAGGSEGVTYNLSAGYFSQKGIWNDTDYERWTFRANNEYKITNKISIGHNLNLSISNAGKPFGTWGSYRIMRSALSASPLITPKDDNGEWNSMQNGDLINPVAELSLNKDYKNKTTRFFGNVWGNWEIIDGLNLRISFGEDWNHSYMDQLKGIYDINSSHQSNSSNTYEENYYTTSTWLWENTLTYDRTFNDIHRFNVLGGFTAEKTTYRMLGASSRNLSLYDKDFGSTAAAPTEGDRTVLTEKPTTVTRASYMFRVNYALKDRYLLTATFRADGSSKFGTNNRWGYFPSAAIGWRINEEDFLKDTDWLSNLKLRASWGQTGNDKITNNVSYALVSLSDEYHAIFNGNVYPGAGLVNASNPDIKWERSQQLDFGFDLGVINNMLTFEFDYFNRETKDLLIILPVKGGSVGISPTYTNAGSVRNRGFEFTTRWQDNRHKFKYGIALSGSTFKNEVTDWSGESTINNDWSTHLYSAIEEGKPLGYFYGYQTQGIYRTQADLDKWNQYAQSHGKSTYHSAAQLGDLIYVDTNGDGSIDDADQTDLGNPFPKFTGSLALNAEYKGFDIYLDFAGSFGAKVMNNSYVDFTSTSNNMHKDWINTWTADNTNASMPRLASGNINTNRTLDIMVFKGDYFKLRSAELGYTLPQSLVSRAGISKLRVYVNGSNLLYFTSYKGFNPEILNGRDWNSYPMAGSVQFGLNLTF